MSQNTVRKELAEHLKQYPNCTAQTCPHTHIYLYKVIFQKPDNGFIGTVTAFNQKQAKRVVAEGVRQSHPHLHVKSIEVSEETYDGRITRTAGLTQITTLP